MPLPHLTDSQPARDDAAGPRAFAAAGDRAHVVIVGGGISGLAAALRLLELDAALHITLLEGDGRLGGKILTERDGGYLLECGPDLFLGARAGGVELCRTLEIANRLHGTTPGLGPSFVLRKGKLFRIPEGLTGLIPTRLGPFARTRLLSPLGKLRSLMDLVIPPRRDEADESVEQFVVRRLGREMYQRLVEPLLSGIHAGDGARLSLRSTFPQLREGERRHGGLLRAAIAARRSPPVSAVNRAPAQMGFLSLPGGLGEIVEAAHARLRESGRVAIRLGTAVTAVRQAARGWQVDVAGETLSADALVMATPAHAAASLLMPVDATLGALLAGIEHVSTIVVSLAYDRARVPRALDASGYTVPRAEGRAVLACTWSSSKFPGRAPEGKALFRLFLGGATRPDVMRMSDAEVLAAARAELQEVLGVTAEPELVRIQRWERALPQPTLGHPARVAGIEEREAALPAFALAGNAYRGVGIPDCIRSGERAAGLVHAYLSRAAVARPSAG
jgi:protoporphyrinogen/coproporphyrinogen III oxidase